MIKNNVLALAISERLRLMGLHNRWYIQMSTTDLNTYARFVFEVKDQQPVECVVMLVATHTFQYVPKLSHDIGNGVMSHLYNRNVKDAE